MISRRVLILSAALLVLGTYGHVLLEWLFFATKLSFLTDLRATQKFQALLVTPILLLFQLLPVFLVGGCAALPGTDSRAGKWLREAAVVVMLFPLACYLLVAIDTCAYTLTRLGMVSVQNDARLIFGLFVVAIAFLLRSRVRRWSAVTNRPLFLRVILGSCVALPVASVFVLAWASGKSPEPPTVVETPRARIRPTILVVSADGVNARRLPMYGYERDTTPWLKDLARNALVFQNCFSNANATVESIVSVLTGRHPLTTGFLDEFSSLPPSDARNSLPAILRNQGYSVVQHTVPRVFDDPSLQAAPPPRRFLGATRARLTQRIQHAFGLARFENEYERVMRGETGGKSVSKDSDRRAVKDIIHKLDGLEPPFFVQVHLMSTHGPVYHPANRRYSKGKRKLKFADDDAFDDALGNADDAVKQLMEYLEKRQPSDGVLFVFFSDHSKTPEGRGWTQRPVERTPLLIRMPGPLPPVDVTAPVQNLDIAPTIIDVLGLERAEGMEGQTLLQQTRDAEERIFISERSAAITLAENRLELRRPPFMEVGYVDTVLGGYSYRLDLFTGEITVSAVPGYTGAITVPTAGSTERARVAIGAFLRARGYPIRRFS